MGKVKATRSVAKPFKHPSRLINKWPSSSSKSSSAVKTSNFKSEESELLNKIPIRTIEHFSGILNIPDSSGKITKKSRNKRNKKKSVTFSKNLTEIGKNSKDSKTEGIIRDILKKSADSSANLSSIVQVVPAGVIGQSQSPKNLIKSTKQQHQRLGDVCRPLTSQADLAALSKGPLRKVLKREVKEKKARFRVKRVLFKNKLEMVKKLEDEARAAKERKKTVIVGDLQPMRKIIQELEEVTLAESVESKVQSSSSKDNKGVPKRSKFKVKKRDQELLDALRIFEAARTHNSN